MKNLIIGLLVFISTLYFFGAQAEEYEGDGSWVLHTHAEGVDLLLAAEVYRENPDEGAIPTFMVNYGEENGCYVSFGLSILEQHIPPQLSKKQTLSMLKMFMEQSDFYVDGEILAKSENRVQALDMGRIILTRTLLDSDSLAAFMLAKSASIRMQDKELVIVFGMDGFEKTMSHVFSRRCH